MSLISIIITLLIVGVILWGIGQLPFIDPPFKKIIYVIVVVLVLLWFLSHLGALDTRVFH